MHSLEENMPSADVATGTWGGREGEEGLFPATQITGNQTWQSMCTPFLSLDTPTHVDLMRYNRRTETGKVDSKAQSGFISVNYRVSVTVHKGKWWQWGWVSLWEEDGRRDASDDDDLITKKSPLERVGDWRWMPSDFTLYNGRLTDENRLVNTYSQVSHPFPGLMMVV